MELILLISDDTYGQEEFEDCTPCDACFRLIELRAYTSLASIVVELRALRVLKTDLEIEVGELVARLLPIPITVSVEELEVSLHPDVIDIVGAGYTK